MSKDLRDTKKHRQVNRSELAIYQSLCKHSVHWLKQDKTGLLCTECGKTWPNGYMVRGFRSEL